MSLSPARTAVFAVVALLLAGCGDHDKVETGGTAGTGTPSAPDRPADISGTITSVTPFEPVTEDCTPAEDLDPDGSVSSNDPPICTPEDPDLLGTILVEAEPGVDGGRKISFTITSGTALVGDGLTSFGDLAEDQTVEAWTTGPCAESYPEQCQAAAVRTLG